jgi:hypothetical protein
MIRRRVESIWDDLDAEQLRSRRLPQNRRDAGDDDGATHCDP